MSPPGYVYLKYCSELDLCKVGVAKNDEIRTKSLQTGNPYKIETINIFYSEYPYKIESNLHREYSCYKKDINNIKLKGEWFKLSDSQINEFVDKCKFLESNIKFLIESNNPFILKKS